MGLTFSCPGGGYDALDQSLDALLKSLRLGNDYIKSSLRSMSFNGRDSDPVLKAWGSGKLLIKNSLSFNKREKETWNAESRSGAKSPNSHKDNVEREKTAITKNTRFGPSPQKIPEKIREPVSPKHEAAVKLQKVYKSFRTRRQLADCAVLVEQRWWKLLDFAMLKRNSVSFFDIEKTESALSKWARAKSRAAKVGKGLSKDEKARKLALQHWLEAASLANITTFFMLFFLSKWNEISKILFQIDPRHRYGHNLHFYYDRWLRCESKQPFFYWLDVGEGKEVSLDEKCPRSKLQHQCIKYLGPKERELYEVIVEDGKLMYKKTDQLLDTTSGDSKDSKWIFVLSTSKNLYVGQKKKGTFQHSSFLAGGATSAAGRLEVNNGILKAIWPHSGHYRPTEENFQEFIAYLESKNVDLTDVKKSPIEEDEEMDNGLRASSWLNSSRKRPEEAEEQISNDSEESNAKLNPEGDETATDKKMVTDYSEESEEEEEQTDEGTKEIVPGDLILRRMKFRKETLSLQLGKKLTCKWTTGAGPRIGCVRDYPLELRFKALEQVNLSPRSSAAAYRAWNSYGNLPSPIPRASVLSTCGKS